MDDLNPAIADWHGRSKPSDLKSVKTLRVECPKSLWLCVGCDRKLQPVVLEKVGDGPDAVILCRCSRCKRLLGQTTEIAVQCLASKRLPPEQGELAELAIRFKLVSYPPQPKEL